MQKRKLSEINYAVIHCSAADHSDDIEFVRAWHIEKGWSDIGYHFFIRKDGEIQTGRPLEIVGAHAKSYNYHSIGICLSGEYDFKEIQFIACAFLLENLSNTIDNMSPVWIIPHNMLNKHKTCPNFKLERIAKHCSDNIRAFYE